MGIAAESFARMLKGLLPRGTAFSVEPETVIGKLALAMADEFARFDVRSVTLIEEFDPRTTSELLTDWERAYGLPDPCAGTTQTVPQRVSSLVQKVIATGGQTKSYFIGLALALGYPITITEFRAYTVEDDVDDLIYELDWNFAWQVNAPIAAAANGQLACVLNYLKPAQTVILFVYT